MPKTEHIGLTSRQVQNFIDDGFVKVENAFSTNLAKQCREELWVDIGLSPDKPDNWIQPVVRVRTKTSPPFIEAANTPRLHRAYDELAGNGRWLVPKALGTFPIRFPSPQFPADLGWHVDTSFGDNNPDFMEWRVNVKSSGRALLMLFLFSDVGPDDAPTKIRKGSHATIARELLPYGDARARHSGSSPPMITLLQKTVRLRWQLARQEQSICAIHSWFMPRKLIEGNDRAS